MSLSGALSNALSGLSASSRSAQITASNLANVLTPGYGRRTLDVGARSLGGIGGVTVNGIVRHVNPALVGDLRLAGAEQSSGERLQHYHARLETLVGTPDKASSLSAQMAEFESSLIAAASRPDLDERLDQVARRASDLTGAFAKISKGIQTLRGEADREIATTVDRLNTVLGQVRDINQRISGNVVAGRDISALQDQRQILIDEVSEIVPVKAVERDLGAVALFTPGGAILLDGTAAEIGFTASNVIVPHMTQSGGHLSGLTLNGLPVETDPDNGRMRGGRLSALFEIRDDLAPAAQSQLDAVARDLVERFQQSGLDATRAPGAAGLFTDGGAAFAIADETGLSARLEINAAVDPAQGGATWRLRDGLGAATPGDSGTAGLLQNMQAVLVELRVPASGGFGVSAQSAADIQTSFLAGIGSDRQISDQVLTFANSQLSEIKSKVLEDGVDSDQEMQRLMLIEQAYAANARMMEVVDEMMQALMRI